eukprot:s4006_g1.t1
MLSVKTDKQVVLLEGHQLQVKPKGVELSSDLGNELRVYQAMIRRGLALEMSNLATYSVHEKVMRKFMSHLNMQAPPGYKAVSIDAILRADRELWTRVADKVRSELRADKNGEMPVDKALEELCDSPSVAFHLLPLPTSAQASNANKRKTMDDDDVPKKVQPKPKAQPKRRTTGRQGRTSLPAGLHGYTGWNKQKQRICYNYNMPHGCSNNVTKDNNFDKCNRGIHQCIKRLCDGQHSHDEWGLTTDGSFATAEECAYDPTLCAHWAEAIACYATRLGYSAPPHTFDEVNSDHLHLKDQANRAILGTLPRGNKLPPLLTDFLQKTVVHVHQFPFLQQAKPGARLPDSAHFPKGARLMRFLNDQQGVFSDQFDDFNGNSNDNSCNVEFTMAEVGIPVEPLEYIKQACNLVHPNAQQMKLSDELEKAIELHHAGASVDLRRVRINWTKSMVELYDQCKDVERGLEFSRPQHLQSVLAGKKFELMRRALDVVGYPDSSIASEASEGLPLVGWMKASGMFATNLRPPELHVDSLVTMAPSFSGRSIASVGPSADATLDREVWEATLAEVEGGTLEGPYDVHDLPRGHIASPRFGLRQGAKVRPIDNLTASGINSTVGLPERLQVDTIDEVASLIKRLMQVHGHGCKLVGRTYDLRKAYRQLGVHEDDYRFSWIAVWSTEHSCVKLFRMKGLPFGGTASVASFLRISRALKELGIRGGALLWSSFFDDFICISRPEDASSADMTIRFLFKSLGWVVSEDPDKDKGFAQVFSALGVQFDLTEVDQGILRIGNTQRRKDELAELVNGFLAADKLTAGESESLRSRLTFAEGQVFGRSSKLALRAVGEPARLGVDCSPLSEGVKFGLQWMLDRIVNAPPRVVTTAEDPPLLLFVDGACEPVTEEGSDLVTSVGAILIDSNGVGLKFFGMRLPDEVTDVWGRDGRRQLVFEAEMLPYLLALACWKDVLAGRNLLVFIDNDGARHSWIKGSADSLHALRMIHKGTLLEAGLDVRPYFCRVPTSSNVADGPSRLDFRLCRALGAEAFDVPMDTIRACAIGAASLVNDQKG